jgi:hypothetical protein
VIDSKNFSLYSITVIFITLNNDDIILICYTNLSKTSLRRKLLMAPSDDPRCRGADEPQTPAHPTSILSEHATLSSDVFTDSLPYLFFTANTLKIKILKFYQKNNFITVIIYFFETLIFLK